MKDHSHSNIFYVSFHVRLLLSRLCPPIMAYSVYKSTAREIKAECTSDVINIYILSIPILSVYRISHFTINRYNLACTSINGVEIIEGNALT